MDAYDTDRMYDIFKSAMKEADRAMKKFPQPNYVLLKIAEEAGEVVKAGVHCSEGRTHDWADVQEESIQLLAMIIRLLVEGDETIGLKPNG